MTPLIGLLAGLAAGLAFVWAASRRGEQGARRIYAVGLVVAALIYLGLAAVGGASTQWLAVESVGVVTYGVVAWAGLRHWATLLAVGWAAHVGWDVLLHLDGPGAAYTPGWYPWLCVSFDLVLAGAVLAQGRQLSAARAPASSRH